MAMPHSPDARRFYRAAFLRMAESNLLLDHRFTTGAVYLAGYGVECMVKALILGQMPPKKQALMMRRFAGRKGHDLERLWADYRAHGGPPLTKDARVAYTLVSTWSTTLRYDPASWDYDKARQFVSSAAHVIEFADGRL